MALQSRLEALEGLLANSDLEALSLFAQMQGELPPSLQGLELEAARTHCLALMDALGNPAAGRR